MKSYLIQMKYYLIKMKLKLIRMKLEFISMKLIIYALFIGNLIYLYVKESSEILFSTNEVTFQLGSIVILHIYNICIYYTNVFYLDILGDTLIYAFVTSVS